MLTADLFNNISRRICEIEGDDDHDQQINFYELDTAILREPQP
jgi:hypothetical protein